VIETSGPKNYKQIGERGNPTLKNRESENKMEVRI
jgi:hypothetical protein